ncbi:MAG: DUF2849 domain-containing protein [Sphingopyxis sp.]
MKILTGNDLADGRVTWWTGTGWSADIAQAVDVGDDAAAILAAEDAARRVNAAYAVDAESTANGPRPLHIKDRVRAVGPTVRLDLSLRPADAAAQIWIA